ncbi:uncharacterized protein CIMG_03737 [Coccidioides immitis RS]|uniref:Uncharacterized protein n=1 Tax=Coccidioides immitis (strain RS) TaxID=246410 RepID=J3KC07_COCIM|nr:uncharacterized protein CIMG_03737 [Coccidioides immitis RS]EAS32713.3 hypothetical protein CIMG_03737 [Coccidioides immitis RS]
MTDAVGDRALSGEWERISIKCFEIQKDMIIFFKGDSCNIVDEEGNLIPDGCLGPSVEETEREAQTICDRYSPRLLLVFPQFALFNSYPKLFRQFINHVTPHKLEG